MTEALFDDRGRRLDQIRLTGVEAHGFHGVYAEERERGQIFRVDVTLHLDVRVAAARDRIEETVHYGELAERIVAVVGMGSVELMETLATRIAGAALSYPGIHAVDVDLHKPQAPIPVPFSDVTVGIRRFAGEVTNPLGGLDESWHSEGDGLIASLPVAPEADLPAPAPALPPTSTPSLPPPTPVLSPGDIRPAAAVSPTSTPPSLDVPRAVRRRDLKAMAEAEQAERGTASELEDQLAPSDLYGEVYEETQPAAFDELFDDYRDSAYPPAPDAGTLAAAMAESPDGFGPAAVTPVDDFAVPEADLPENQSELGRDDGFANSDTADRLDPIEILEAPSLPEVPSAPLSGEIPHLPSRVDESLFAAPQQPPAQEASGHEFAASVAAAPRIVPPGSVGPVMTPESVARSLGDSRAQRVSRISPEGVELPEGEHQEVGLQEPAASYQPPTEEDTLRPDEEGTADAFLPPSVEVAQPVAEPSEYEVPSAPTFYPGAGGTDYPEGAEYLDETPGVAGDDSFGLGPLERRPVDPVAAVLALGANVGPTQQTLRQAVFEVDSADGVWVDAIAPLARTSPVGGPDQPLFLNTVIQVTTILSPRELLQVCQDIETRHGRVRTEVNGPRTLDIDIITYHDFVETGEGLELPHPRAFERAFVLIPWSEMDPLAVLPGFGGGLVSELAALTPDRDGVRYMALDWFDESTLTAAIEAAQNGEGGENGGDWGEGEDIDFSEVEGNSPPVNPDSPDDGSDPMPVHSGAIEVQEHEHQGAAGAEGSQFEPAMPSQAVLPEEPAVYSEVVSQGGEPDPYFAAQDHGEAASEAPQEMSPAWAPVSQPASVPPQYEGAPEAGAAEPAAAPPSVFAGPAPAAAAPGVQGPPDAPPIDAPNTPAVPWSVVRGPEYMAPGGEIAGGEGAQSQLAGQPPYAGQNPQAGQNQPAGRVPVRARGRIAAPPAGVAAEPVDNVTSIPAVPGSIFPPVHAPAGRKPKGTSA